MTLIDRDSPAPVRDASVAPSDSQGVDIVLKGWKTGLNKVALTKTLRAGGVGLGEASKITGRVLEGEEVRVHLTQCPTLNQARDA